MAAIAEARLAAAPKRFDLGRVIERAFGAMGRNAFKFAVLSFVLGGGPAAMVALGISSRPADPESPFATYTPLFFGGLATYFVCGLLLQAALIYGAVTQFGGRKASLGSCVAAGVRSLLPVLAIAFLMWLALLLSLFGWALTIRSLVSSGLLRGGVAPLAAPFSLVVVSAPASFLMTVWAVVVPAAVVDRAGVFGAFARSWVLTRKSRWAIFLLGVAWTALAAIVFVLSILLAAAISEIGLDPSSSVAVAWLVMTPLGTVIGATGLASTYYELRMLKEGADPSRLAEVFD